MGSTFRCGHLECATHPSCLFVAPRSERVRGAAEQIAAGIAELRPGDSVTIERNDDDAHCVYTVTFTRPAAR